MPMSEKNINEIFDTFNPCDINIQISMIYSKVSFIRHSLVRNIRLYVFFHIPRRKPHIANTFNYSLIRYSFIRFIRLYVLNQTRFRKEIIHLCVITCYQPHRGDQFASQGDTARLRMAKTRAAHWRAAARGLQARNGR